MYATRSTMRTMRPSSESGGVGPVVEDPVARLQREVQAAPVALQAVDDAQRVLVVVEAPAGAGLQRGAQGLLAGVPERRVAEVVAERDGLRQVLVEPQGARDRARDADDLERVREPRAVVVALGRDEHLGLVLEAAERLAWTMRSRSRWNGERRSTSPPAAAVRASGSLRTARGPSATSSAARRRSAKRPATGPAPASLLTQAG